MPKTQDRINPSLNKIVNELQTKVTKKAFLEFKVKENINVHMEHVLMLKRQQII